MSTKAILYTLILLAPAAYGCVVFQAALGSPCDGNELYSVLTDNGYAMCTMKGNPFADDVYHYTCLKANFTAAFDASTGVINYETDHGSWLIKANSTGSPPAYWTACVFGCSEQECWVKTASNSSDGCR